MTPTYQGVLRFNTTETIHTLRTVYRVEPWIATLGLVFVSPVVFAAAFYIWVASGRAPFIRHKRVGLHGADLPMLKLRTMWRGRSPIRAPFLVEDIAGHVPQRKDSEDERVTSTFAAWCRKLSIDELPQLIHVARGEMSFVGPRPITHAELEEHYGEDASRVLIMRPGLTGLWQILGRNRLTYPQRKRLDLWLVRRAGPALYFRILWRSIPEVLHGNNAY